MQTLDLDAELTALPHMSRPQLRQRWIDLTGGPAPRVSARLMRLALAYELQAAVHGTMARSGWRSPQAARMRHELPSADWCASGTENSTP